MKATIYAICFAVVTLFSFSQRTSAQDYSFYNNMFSNMLPTEFGTASINSHRPDTLKLKGN
jgi:hypothetical protein